VVINQEKRMKPKQWDQILIKRSFCFIDFKASRFVEACFCDLWYIIIQVGPTYVWYCCLARFGGSVEINHVWLEQKRMHFYPGILFKY